MGNKYHTEALSTGKKLIIAVKILLIVLLLPKREPKLQTLQ